MTRAERAAQEMRELATLLDKGGDQVLAYVIVVVAKGEPRNMIVSSIDVGEAEGDTRSHVEEFQRWARETPS